jgi:TPR repeat protein
MRAGFICGVIIAVLASACPASSAEVRERIIVHPPEVVVRVEPPIVRITPREATKLGFRYEFGRGVPQDYVLAATWYRWAAEQGDPDGQHLLGLLYDRGLGVPEDHVEAHKWLNLAAAGASRDNRDYYSRVRNAVSSKIPRAAVAEAQRRARHWAPVPPW